MTTTEGPCFTELQVATQCLQMSTDDCSCFDLATFQLDFPQSISTKFVQQMAFASPSDPTFCSMANAEACTFYQENQSCCCQEETAKFRTCYIETAVNEAVPFPTPCMDTCGVSDESETTTPEKSGGSGGKVVLILFLLILFFGGGYYYYRKRRTSVEDGENDSMSVPKSPESRAGKLWAKMKQSLFQDEYSESDLEAGENKSAMRRFWAKFQRALKQIRGDGGAGDERGATDGDAGDKMDEDSLSLSSHSSHESSSLSSSSNSSLDTPTSASVDIVSTHPESTHPESVDLRSVENDPNDFKTLQAPQRPQLATLHEERRIQELEREKAALKRDVQVKEQQATLLQMEVERRAQRISQLEAQNADLQQSVEKSLQLENSSDTSLDLEDLASEDSSMEYKKPSPHRSKKKGNSEGTPSTKGCRSSSSSLDFLEAHHVHRYGKKRRSGSSRESQQATREKLREKRNQKETRAPVLAGQNSSKLDDLCAHWQTEPRNI